MSLSRASDAKEFCDGNQCSREASPHIEASTTLAHVSTVAFVTAGIGLGVALITWAARPARQPQLGLHPFGLCGSF
jgi:hypothetical protein